MTAFDPHAALAYPWPLKSRWSIVFDQVIKIVIAGDQKRPCFICGAEVKVGETARVRFEVRQRPERGQRTWYGCAECCVAMAAGEAAVQARRMRRSA